jgi:hypothetical protein
MTGLAVKIELANIVGPPDSATRIRASMAARHHGTFQK